MIGKYNAIRSDAYMAWVRTLPCANCGASEPSDCHHKIGHGRVGTVKTHDTEAMPLCRTCHTLLHSQGWVAFEMVNQCQMRMSLETIALALQEGILNIDTKLAKDISK